MVSSVRSRGGAGSGPEGSRLEARLGTGLCVVALLASACTCSEDVDLGEGRDAGSDAAAVTVPRTEECGNGLDDDRDGRIDDGCPCAPGETQACFSADYPSSGLGACRDGVQTCVGRGSEWGDWGDASCEGETVPTEEMCDGMDRDCDGSTDEACPCTEGQERACAVEFVIAPCRPGTQTCRSAEWSGCEGAVEPRAEVCGDGVDNDCDGEIDDEALCVCRPVPEVCGNGDDDDCDGEVDEPDACMSVPDGGLDAGLDGGGARDAGAPLCAGGCTPTAWRDVGPATSGGVFPSSANDVMSACAIPSGGVAVVLKDDADLRLRRLDSAGALLVDTPLGLSMRSDADHDVGEVVCLDDRFAIAFQDTALNAQLATFDYGGTLLAGPVLATPVPGTTSIGPGLGRLGSELYVFWMQASAVGQPHRLFSRRFDFGLAPLGDRTLLTPAHTANNNFLQVVPRSSDLAVLFATSSEHHLVTVSGDVAGPVVPVTPLGVESLSSVHLAWVPGSMALCWAYIVNPVTGPYETRCRYLTEAGAPTGPVETLTRAGMSDGLDFGLTADACSYRLTSYCRTTTTGSCPTGGESFVGDPAAGTWAGVRLPARPRTDTLVGYLPYTTALVLDGDQLWHFGLSRSNGAGTTQLHDLRFDCAP